MPSRVLRMLPNDRWSAWGLVRRGRAAFGLLLERSEVEVVRVDATTWLDVGETIATAVSSGSLGPVVEIVAGNMAVDLTVTGSGAEAQGDLVITTSDGRVRRIRFEAQAAEGAVTDSYRSADA